MANRFHLGWDTVKDTDQKYLDRELNPPDFTGVEGIAVDEISIKKHHK